MGAHLSLLDRKCLQRALGITLFVWHWFGLVVMPRPGEDPTLFF